MLDWQGIVRQRLSGLALDPAEKDEVHAELAAHLEESYAVFCKQGLGKEESARRTMEQASDWQDLQRRIIAAKERGHLMKKRVQQLWIPGFLTFILSTVFLMTLQKLGFRPRIIGDGPNRSEEHTSELQSHHDLVCRLLLEKKKKKQQTYN